MALRLALRALRRNRLRSALTALGVIIGVAALITTVVTGEGARKAIAQQIASMGSAMLMIVPGASVQGGFVGGAGSGRPLLREDIDAIKQGQAVRYAVPTYCRSMPPVLTSSQQSSLSGSRTALIFQLTIA